MCVLFLGGGRTGQEEEEDGSERKDGLGEAGRDACMRSAGRGRVGWNGSAVWVGGWVC